MSSPCFIELDYETESDLSHRKWLILRRLALVAITLQHLYFDRLIDPFFITWYNNNGIKNMAKHLWTNLRPNLPLIFYNSKASSVKLVNSRMRNERVIIMWGDVTQMWRTLTARFRFSSPIILEFEIKRNRVKNTRPMHLVFVRLHFGENCALLNAA